MKKFYTKTLLFCLIPILYCITNFIINSQIIKSSAPIISEEVIIIGDSHTEYGLMSDKFPSAVNIGQVAEPYFVTFWKLKSLAKKGKFKHVILGFSHQNISSFNDAKLYTPSYSKELFERVYPIINFKNLEKLKVNYTEYASTIVKEMCLYPAFKHHENYYCRFVNDTKSSRRIDNYKQSINRHYFKDEDTLGVSTLCNNYLDSIITFCNLNKLRLSLITSPVREVYFENIPVKFKKAFNQKVAEFKLRKIEFYDYSNFKLDEIDFYDADHLSKKGANKITDDFITKLNSYKSLNF